MGLRHRLIGWIVAYAFVLHTLLAGIVATQIAAAGAGFPGFELCRADADTDGAVPAHSQHENCAIHCNAIAGSVPALLIALVALLYPVARRAVHPCAAGCLDLLRRAGLGSRAPPLPA